MFVDFKPDLLNVDCWECACHWPPILGGGLLPFNYLCVTVLETTSELAAYTSKMANYPNRDMSANSTNPNKLAGLSLFILGSPPCS